MNLYRRSLTAILALITAVGCGRHAAKPISHSLCEAAGEDDLGAAQNFVNVGVDVNQRDVDGNTPLIWSGYSGYGHGTAMADLLLSHGADVNYRARNGETPLTLAVVSGRDDIVERLIAHGADVNQGNAKSQTPLMLAIIYPRIVVSLLNAGADVNRRDNLGRTAIGGVTNMEILANLVAHGADVNAVDLQGETPFKALVAGGFVDAAKFLAAHGARVVRQGPAAQELICLALMQNTNEMLKALVDLGVDINATDAKGNTMLTQTFWGVLSPTRVRWLVDAGIDFRRTNPQGLTPREWAEQSREFKIANLLERYENGLEHPAGAGRHATETRPVVTQPG